MKMLNWYIFNATPAFRHWSVVQLRTIKKIMFWNVTGLIVKITRLNKKKKCKANLVCKSLKATSYTYVHFYYSYVSDHLLCEIRMLF